MNQPANQNGRLIKNYQLNWKKNLGWIDLMWSSGKIISDDSAHLLKNSYGSI